MSIYTPNVEASCLYIGLVSLVTGIVFFNRDPPIVPRFLIILGIVLLSYAMYKLLRKRSVKTASVGELESLEGLSRRR